MSNIKWLIAKNRTRQGPFSREQLDQMAESGSLLPSDMVLQVGSLHWMKAETISGLFTPIKRTPNLATLADETVNDANEPTPNTVPVLIGVAIVVFGALNGAFYSIAAITLYLVINDGTAPIFRLHLGVQGILAVSSWALIVGAVGLLGRHKWGMSATKASMLGVIIPSFLGALGMLLLDISAPAFWFYAATFAVMTGLRAATFARESPSNPRAS